MKKRAYITTATSISPNGVKGEDGILHAVESDYKEIITNANLRRRMSRFVKMGVACGLLCIQKSGSKPIDAIITATGFGCLSDTEKFLNSIINNDERLLNPTAFSQSTFNVIGAQIALLTGNSSYNNTFVHRGLSFESALIDAMMRIYDGDRNVLVGAIDETNTTAHAIMQKMGLLTGVTLGEGAHFFTLSNEPSETHLELKAVKALSCKISHSEILAQIRNFLKAVSLDENDVGVLLTGENGNTDQDKIYKVVARKLFPSAKVYTFKNVCGEYPTASSYALYITLNSLMTGNSIPKNILIYNHYNTVSHALILLGQ